MRILRKHRAELIRYDSKGYYDENGRWVRGTDSKPEPLLCCIQPNFKKDGQKDLPEGVSEKDCRIIWTETELKGASEYGNIEADIVRYQGQDFEVFDADHWYGAGKINAWEGLIIKKDKL